MKVFIMRHGEAELNAPSDVERQLSLHGQQQCRLVAKWLQLQSISFDYAFVSPYMRAKQTWNILHKDLKLLGKMEISSKLTPSGEAQMVRDCLCEIAQKGMRNTLIVSHLPLVGYLVSELCPGIESPMFPTASICCVSVDSEITQGNIEWMHHAV